MSMFPFIRLATLAVCLTAALPLFAARHTWSGAVSGAWSDARNWSDSSPAGDADAELFFPVQATTRDTTNDLASLSVKTIQFAGTGYTLRGNALGVTFQIIDSSRGANEIALDLTLGSTVILTSEGSLSITGTVSGGALVKRGDGTVVLAGASANTFGATTVENGRLTLDKPDGVAAVGGNVTIRRQTFSGEVVLLSHEQIPDTAVVTIHDGTFELGAQRETLAAVHMRSGRVLGDEATLQTRELRCLTSDFTASSVFAPLAWTGELRVDTAAGCGIVIETLRGGGTLRKEGEGQLHLGTNLRFDQPIFVRDGTLRAKVASPVTIERGILSGEYGSVTANGGELESLVVHGDLRMTQNVIAHAYLHRTTATYRVAGNVELGGATLEISGATLRNPRVPILDKGSAGPIRGMFSGFYEGDVVTVREHERVRLTYTGGNGNDVFADVVSRIRTRTRADAEGTIVTTTVKVGDFDVSEPYPPVTGVVDLKMEIEEQEYEVFATQTLVDGVATFALPQLEAGVYNFYASYRGDDRFHHSSYGPVTVDVPYPAATVSFVTPSTVPLGPDDSEIVVTGSGFAPDAAVMLNETWLQTVQVSSTRLRAIVPRGLVTSPASMTLTVRRNAKSNGIPFNFAPAGEALKPAVTFESNLAVARGFTAGGHVAWNGNIARGSSRTIFMITTDDPDGDGISILRLPGVPSQNGVVGVVDVASGDFSVATTGGGAPERAPFPANALQGLVNGKPTRLSLSATYEARVVWVRPGAGAWRVVAFDGANHDADEYYGTLEIPASAFEPMGPAEPASPPSTFEPDDVLVLIDSDERMRTARVRDLLADATYAPLQVGFLEDVVVRAGNHTTADFVVRLSAPLNDAVTVRYRTHDGSAKRGTNYTRVTGTLTFAPGETEQVISVPVHPVNGSDAPVFSLILHDARGASIAYGHPLATVVTTGRRRSVSK